MISSARLEDAWVEADWVRGVIVGRIVAWVGELPAPILPQAVEEEVEQPLKGGQAPRAIEAAGTTGGTRGEGDFGVAAVGDRGGTAENFAARPPGARAGAWKGDVLYGSRFQRRPVLAGCGGVFVGTYLFLAAVQLWGVAATGSYLLGWPGLLLLRGIVAIAIIFLTTWIIWMLDGRPRARVLLVGPTGAFLIGFWVLVAAVALSWWDGKVLAAGLILLALFGFLLLRRQRL